MLFCGKLGCFDRSFITNSSIAKKIKINADHPMTKLMQFMNKQKLSAAAGICV